MVEKIYGGKTAIHLQTKVCKSILPSRMKIAVVGHSIMGKRNFDLFKNMGKNEIYLIAPNQWETLWGKEMKYEKNNYENIKVILTNVFFMGFVPFFIMPDLKNILMKIKPDIVLTFGEPYSFIAIQSQAICSKLNIPHIIFTWENLESNYKLYFLTRSYVLKRCKGIVAGNTEAKRLCIKYGAKCPIIIAPQSGIDTNLFNDKAGNLRKKLNLSGKIILFAGRFVKEKGVYYLLGSLNKLKEKYKDVFLILSGGGPELKNVESFIKKNRLSNCTKILIWVDYEDMPKLYSTADIFVYPSYESSKWKEQFGFAIIEAMACGIPIIATKNGAIPGVVDNNAILINQKSVEELTEAIIKVFEGKKERKKKERMMDYVKKKYSIENVAKKYLFLFEKVIKNQKDLGYHPSISHSIF